MTVKELIRRLRECDPAAEVRIDDEELLAAVEPIEPIETNDGPVVLLWSASRVED